jgi:hypothetical protein
VFLVLSGMIVVFLVVAVAGVFLAA